MALALLPQAFTEADMLFNGGISANFRVPSKKFKFLFGALRPTFLRLLTTAQDRNLGLQVNLPPAVNANKWNFVKIEFIPMATKCTTGGNALAGAHPSQLSSNRCKRRKSDLPRRYDSSGAHQQECGRAFRYNRTREPTESSNQQPEMQSRRRICCGK